MIHVEPMKLEEHIVLGITVKLPKTNLIVITTEKGFIMCGASGI
jgi:uncharacterized protein YunC (DUF1805 family)